MSALRMVLRYSRWIVRAVTLGLAMISGPAGADQSYGPGVSDTEIRIGQTMPYSGPVSAYGSIGRTQAAYFRMLNDRGGINGRKVKLISLDDGYSPARTVEQVRKLVEQEAVFALFQLLGAAPNSAVIRYTNARGIPSLFIGSVVDKHADAEAYPWTVLWNPPSSVEGGIQGRWLMQHRPAARIAILYQNDDLGRDLTRAFKAGIGERAARQVIAQASFELSDATLDSQVITLKASGADVLFLAATPRFGAQAIRKVHDLGWRPLFMISNTLTSIEATLKPAGLDKATGLISAGYFKSDPGQWAEDPAMQAYRAMMRKYYPEANPLDGVNVYGYLTAMALEVVLRRCGDNLTRENLMQQARNLDRVALPILFDGITLNTTPRKHYPIDTMLMMRFDGQYWRILPVQD